MSKNKQWFSAGTFGVFVAVAVVAFFLGLALRAPSKNVEQNQASQQSAEAPVNALVGKPLPDVQFLDKDGMNYDFQQLKGKNIVLFFNEGLMCYPACWNQIASFGSDQRFNAEDMRALSVVVDSPNDWKQAIAQMPELDKATTLFDTNANMSRKFGLLTAGSSMHAGQLPGHTYMLIDKAGVVREVFDDTNMAINNDVIMEKMSAF